MNPTGIRRHLSDLWTVNRRYLTDSGYRDEVRGRTRPNAPAPAAADAGPNRGGIAQAEFDRVPDAARPYRDLVETSLALASATYTDAVPHLNVVVNEVQAGKAFAGVQTAITVGVRLAEQLGLPVRILQTSWTAAGNSEKAAAGVVHERFGDVVTDVVGRERLHETTLGTGDVWLATHWKTAHAIDVAAIAGLVARDRVAYLVQDYEPGFSPWSTEFAVARSTYHAGYHFMVNSTPLREFLLREEGVAVPDERTFTPHLDVELLERVAGARTQAERTTVFFYGRPTKHRNLYRLGLSALKVAAAELGADFPVEFRSAGEKHRDVDLGTGHKLRSLGSLPWDDYFDFIAGANVVLSLQYSPHPSHPPFDGAISGARSVTNEFHDTRAELHPNLTAVPAESAALGRAVADAVRAAAANGPLPFTPLADGKLGIAMDAAVASVATELAVVIGATK